MKATRYRLTVWATVPHDNDGEPEWTSREIERYVYKTLQKYGPDCDVEVMDNEEIEVEP